MVCERSSCRAASRLSFQIQTCLINVIVDFSSKLKNASAAPSLLGLDARNVFLRIHRRRSQFPRKSMLEWDLSTSDCEWIRYPQEVQCSSVGGNPASLPWHQFPEKMHFLL